MVRTKTKIKTPSLYTFSSQAQLHFLIAEPSTFCLPTGAAGWRLGLQSVHNTDSATPSSYFSPVLAWGPSHWIQFFMNFMLHCGSSAQCTVCQEQTTPTWVSLWLQFLPGAGSSTGSPWAASSFRASPPAASWGPPWAAL